MSSTTLDERGIIARCPSCGRANRRTYIALERPARCGSCHADLAPLGEPVDVPSAVVFDALVAQATVPVLVDFWAEWCGPCHMMAPELAKAARQLAGRAVTAKINTETLPELSSRFGIRSIPTLAVFRNGVVTARTAGAQPASAIAALAQ